MACCGGNKECTGRCECNRAAPDAQRSANATNDSGWNGLLNYIGSCDPQHHNVCLSFGVNISVSCLLYCNTIVQEHLQVLGPILLLARTVDQLDR